MSKFDKIFDIPEEISSDIPKVTIIGFDRMLVENFFIRIKMKSGIVNINGFELVMKEMTKDDLIIIGNIESVDYEKNVM